MEARSVCHHCRAEGVCNLLGGAAAFPRHTSTCYGRGYPKIVLKAIINHQRQLVPLRHNVCDYEKMSSHYIYKGIPPPHMPKSGRTTQGRPVRSMDQRPNTTQVILSREEVASLSLPHPAFGGLRQVPAGSTDPVLRHVCSLSRKVS